MTQEKTTEDNNQKDKQDKEFWDKFCKVFNVDVSVSVQKIVTKDDIILSLLNEGDFIFMQQKGHTKMNLKDVKERLTKEDIKNFKRVLWMPVEEYLLKQLKDTPKSKEKNE